ncbi:MAG: tetraacyldisaccharide 4'-kinase [Deltaproteobacteria bacterium]|nr:MAG: tetraacyldisaccharide 4'-kinase [Deltaproteobacteria bacterium]
MENKLLYALGRPFSPLYTLAMHLRAAGYRRGFFRVQNIGVPVVSIGNLTMGGTGKTPLVRHIAQLLQKEGRQPAIISRGYGGKATGAVNRVSDGRQVCMSPAEAGDEPWLLAWSLPAVPVLTGVVRRLPAAEAVLLGADSLVLDDGFQHMALARDLDLVLFNADTLAGNSRVFPGGDLREPVAALHRAHAFVLTSVNDGNRQRASRFAELLMKRFPEKPVWQVGYRPRGWYRLGSEGAFTILDTLPAQRGYAFCGIARPRGFTSALAELEIDIAGFQRFADHFRYTARSVASIERAAQKAGATLLITTEKDLVKLSALPVNMPCYALRMEVVTEKQFDRWLLDRLFARSLQAY